MGKSKKRNFNKISDTSRIDLKRKDAVKSIISDIKSRKINDNTKNLIGLFGITPEELTESGLPFEFLSACKDIFL